MNYSNQQRAARKGRHSVAAGLLALAALSTTSAAQDAALATAIERALGDDYYEAVWQVGTPLPGVAAGWQAPNKEEDLRTFFLEDGVVIQPRVAGAESWNLQLTLSELRRGSATLAVPAGEVVHAGTRMELRRDGIVEWYVNDERGLEQGFDLARRFGESDETLELVIDVGGTFSIEELGGDRVSLTSDIGDGRLSLTGLFAFDANGLELPVRFARAGDDLALSVDDRGAQYPITIDPMVHNPLAQIAPTGAAPNGEYGQAVTIRDDRAVIAAPGINHVYVFQLIQDNWSLRQTIVEASPEPGAEYGLGLALGNDLLIVGAPGDPAGNLARAGRAYAYRFNGSFFAFESFLTAPVPQVDGRFGQSLATDGEWLVVGAPGQDTTHTDTGAIFAFRRIAGQWDHHQSTTVQEEASRMGEALDLEGSELVVGRPGAGGGAGAVQVYRLGTSGSFFGWLPQQSLTVPNTENLGASIDLNNAALIAGAPEPASSNTRGRAQTWLRASSVWSMSGQIIGDKAGDEFGASVSIHFAASGDLRALVGAPGYAQANGQVRGAAYFFEREGSGWAVERLYLGGFESRTGASVALFADHAIVGMPLDVVGVPIGQAEMLRRVGGNWVSFNRVFALDMGANDHFASAVAISEDLAVVGCSGDDNGAFQGGAAYTMVRNGTSWKLSGKLTAGAEATSFAHFGTSVAVHGTTVVVGVPGGRHTNGTRSGFVYEFEQLPDGTWSDGSRVEPHDPSSAGEFGHSIALDGAGMVVGAPDTLVGGVERGAAYAYGRDGSGFFLQTKLVESGKFDDRLGESVDIRGNRIVVGVPGHDASGKEDVGQVRVYRRQNGSWSTEFVLDDLDPQKDARYGASVGADGKLVAVGAPGRDSDDGRVVVWRREGAGWVLETLLTAPVSGGQFGYSLDLDEQALAVGAPFADENGINAGEAYLYLPVGSSWKQVELARFSSHDNDKFGSSVAVGAGFVLVGAPDKKLLITEEGMVYLYDVPTPQPFTYCEAKPGLVCGTPSISFSGQPSASAPSGFVIEAGPARTQRTGLFVYTDQGPADVPFQDGTLCLQPPLRRSVPVTSSGPSACAGTFAIDWNAFAHGALGGKPRSFLLELGQQVNVQVWGRDSVATGSFLSDGLEYCVGP